MLFLHTMYRNFEDSECCPNQADENVHMVDNALPKAMAAEVHMEDRQELQSVPLRRVLEVLREPLSATTVSDLLAAESQTFSVAVTQLGMYGTEEFLKLMSVWFVIMWRISITAHVYHVVLELDEFGCVARRGSPDDLVVAQRTILRQAAAAKFILDDNTRYFLAIPSWRFVGRREAFEAWFASEVKPAFHSVMALYDANAALRGIKGRRSLLGQLRT
jgi:hypothetical protein